MVRGEEPDNVRYLRPQSRIVAGVQDWILHERLTAGDALPPVDELAHLLGVNTATITQALRALESMRVLDRSPGGHVVSSTRSPLVDQLLRLRMALSDFGRDELMSIRVDLERGAAARAAVDAEPAELSELHSIVDEMATPTIGVRRFGELDCEFHTRLAQAGHNELAALLLTSLGDAVQQEMRAAYGRTPHWPLTAARLAREHRAILDAVHAHDPTAASESVSGHIHRFYDLRAC